ncbi:MAG: DUF2971 domain-containing protein [Methanolobus sp.]|jgi:hypothetical protein|nr:DUF2971 domain-containing protein [Methanolobus sp.]
MLKIFPLEWFDLIHGVTYKEKTFNNQSLFVSMTLIKFMPLNDSKYFCRAKQIIEKNKFWCSRFYNLNDPMEGIFKSWPEQAEFMWDLKLAHLICSFSDSSSLGNPLMWGHYAAGFQGIAIEVDIGDSSSNRVNLKGDSYIKRIQYKLIERILDDDSECMSIDTIFCRKLCNWKYENEWRFIKKATEEGYYGIELLDNSKKAKIINVYFGEPYKDIGNSADIIQKSKSLKKYRFFKEALEEICKNKGITPISFDPWEQQNYSCNCTQYNCNKRTEL